MFTNCIDDDECTRDSEVDKIMSTFIENNNERMNLTWSTDPNKWDVWDSKYIYIYIFF